jgi:UPF0755 protein
MMPPRWLTGLSESARSGRFWIYSAAGIALVLCLIAAAGYHSLLSALNTPFKGFAEDRKLVLISPGTRTEGILAQLRTEGILEHEFPEKVYLWWNRGRGRMKAGEYLFDRPLTAVEVLEKLIEGKVYQHSITFPEGLTLREIAQVMESKGFGPREGILQALSDPSSIKELDPAAKDLEGYLFPDTYFYIRGTAPAELVRKMVGRFKAVFAPEWVDRAATLGLGVHGAVTLASLIEKETGIDAERPIISAVFHRRMAKGMLLQCDPTVIYAAVLAGRYDGVIHKSDLELKSPYNTYQSAGLPPGPIANPGAKALHAALYPVKSDYLYFVARNDGTHQFSGTLAEHHKATRLHQR